MNRIAVVAIILAGLMMPACEEREETVGRVEKATPSPIGERGPSGQEVRREFSEAMSALRAYTMDRSEEYRERMETQLDKMEQRLSELRVKLRDATEEGREEIQKSINDLDEKIKTERKNLRESKPEDQTSWEKFKERMHAAGEEIQDAYEKAMSKLKK